MDDTNKSLSQDPRISLDSAIEKTNAWCKELGLPPIVTSFFKQVDRLTPTALKLFREQIRANGELKVDAPWGKNNKYELTFNKSSTGDIKAKYAEHIATLNFAAPYAARKFLDAFFAITDASVPKPSRKFLGPNKLHVNEWFIVQSPYLEDILEHTYSKDENKWRLPVPYSDYAPYIARYHWGVHPQINSRSGEVDLPAEQLEQFRTVLGKTPRGKEAVKQGRAIHKSIDRHERKQRQNADGQVSLAQICIALKIDPKEARNALRKSNTPKPASGSWSWPAEEQQKIEKLVGDAVAKLRGKKK